MKIFSKEKYMEAHDMPFAPWVDKCDGKEVTWEPCSNYYKWEGYRFVSNWCIEVDNLKDFKAGKLGVKFDSTDDLEKSAHQKVQKILDILEPARKKAQEEKKGLDLVAFLNGKVAVTFEDEVAKRDFSKWLEEHSGITWPEDEKPTEHIGCFNSYHVKRGHLYTDPVEDLRGELIYRWQNRSDLTEDVLEAAIIFKESDALKEEYCDKHPVCADCMLYKLDIC